MVAGNESNENGFSILEMGIVLIISSILAAISLTSLNQFIQRTTDKTIQTQIINAIHLAERHAAANYQPVKICNNKSCSNRRQNELVVLMNDNIIAISQLPRQHGVLHWHSYPSYRDYLLFSPDGLAENDNGTFWYCYASKYSPAWAITLNKAGKVSLLYPDKHNIIKDSKGKPLLCQ